MTDSEVLVIHIFLYSSLAMSLMALLFPIFRIWQRKRGSHLHVHADTLLIVSVFVLLATWAMRFAVGYYRIMKPAENDEVKLSCFEEVFNSIVHALQTFSMDEDYTEYLTDGRAMIAAIGASENRVTLFGAFTAILNTAAPILGGAVVLNILLSFLPRAKLCCHRFFIFERQYFFSELNERALALAKSLCDKTQYQKGMEKYHRPLIVFTDAYTDKDQEESAELLEEARALGAICLKEDLVNIIKRPIFNFKREYILIDVNELNNVRTLAELSGEKHWKKLKRSVVRIFYQDDSFSVTERQIIDGVWEKYTKVKSGRHWSFRLSDFVQYYNLSTQARYEVRISANKRGIYEGVIAAAEELGAKSKLKEFAKRSGSSDAVISSAKVLSELIFPEGLKEEDFERFSKTIDRERALADMPAILRIRSFQHIIYQMLRDLPLYRPLFAKAPEEDGTRTLNVGIIGFGGIGMEMLLASAWFGQMNGVRLAFNLVSAEEPEVMIKKLNRRAPELLHSASPDDPVLQIFRNDTDHYGDRYFTFRCANADVMLEPLDRIMCREYIYPKLSDCKGIQPDLPQPVGNSDGHSLLDCDYYLVSTGKDDRNIEIAEQLRRAVTIRRMNQGTAEEKKETPLVTVAYVVYDTDLAETLNSRPSDGVTELVAVGSSKEIYSRRNMMLTDSRQAASEMQKLYNAVQDQNGKSPETQDQRTVRTNVRAQMHEEMKKRSGDIYSWMSSTARGMHRKYKAFSVWQFLMRDPQNAERCETLCKSLLLPGEMLGEPHKDALQVYIDAIKEDPMIEAELTWLEHRRWNAYMRACGFLRRIKGDKDLMLRLHPMIVEIKPAGSKDSRPDLLDDISKDKGNDYKKYDKPLE